MLLRDILVYNSMLGLAGLSGRYQARMGGHVVKMAQTAGQAAVLQAQASEQTAAAARNEEQAAADTAEAQALRQESTTLLELSQEQTAAAAAEELEAREAAAAAAQAQAAAVAHDAAAAADQQLAADELEASAVDGVAAARAQAVVEGDEVTTGLCQLVPLLDVACDVIGSVTAVVWEGIAADEATKSGLELAASVAAAAEEEREFAAAAEREEVALQETAEAAEFHEQAAAAEERAQEERVEAEELQAEAGALTEKAEGETALADEEAADAVAESDEASNLVRESASLGVRACWEGLVAALVGVISLVFFGVQVLFRVVIPWAFAAHSSLSTVAEKGVVGGSISKLILRHTSVLLHHCGMFVMCTTTYYGGMLSRLAEMSMQGRGGALLQFAFTASSVQTVCLHTIPHAHSTRGQEFAKAVFDVGLNISKHILLLGLLFMLEIMTLWIIFGPGLFSALLLPVNVMWLAVTLLISSGLHLWLLEEYELEDGRTKLTAIATEDCSAESEEEGMLSSEPSRRRAADINEETTSLLAQGETADSKPTSSAEVVSTNRSFGSITSKHARSFVNYFVMLQLPLECLVLAWMVAVLRHCLPNLALVWPASKALLRATIPPWVVLVAYGIAGVASLAVIIWTIVLIRSCRLGARKRNEQYQEI